MKLPFIVLILLTGASWLWLPSAHQAAPYNPNDAPTLVLHRPDDYEIHAAKHWARYHGEVIASAHHNHDGIPDGGDEIHTTWTLYYKAIGGHEASRRAIAHEWRHLEGLKHPTDPVPGTIHAAWNRFGLDSHNTLLTWTTEPKSSYRVAMAWLHEATPTEAPGGPPW